MITAIDHVVPTVRDVDRAAAFYAGAPGLEVRRFGAGRTALHFGTQKINLQRLGQETRNHAAIGAGVDIPEGPVEKTGARGPMPSACFTDPDGNLIEIASYERAAP